MTKFKINIGNQVITDETPKEKIEALKKHYPHLDKVLKKYGAKAKDSTKG